MSKNEKKIKPEKIKKIKLPKTIQQTIPIEDIMGNGIIRTDMDTYSKMYSFNDSNFNIDTEEGQEQKLLHYESLLSHFADNISLSIVIIDKRVPLDEIRDSFYIKESNDTYDRYRKCYNKIIDSKIREGRNDIRKQKYIIMSAVIKNKEDVSSTFSYIDNELNVVMQDLNKTGVTPLNDYDRLELIDIYYKGNREVTFKSRAKKYFSDGNLDKKALAKSSQTVRDLIAPFMLQKCGKGGNQLCLAEDRYCKSFMITELPPSLDTTYLSKVTNIPCEMVYTVNFSLSPRKQAERTVRHRNNDIKSEILKKSKDALKAGYDPQYTLSESLLEAREEASELRKEVISERKRAFFVTITTTIFAQSEDELKELCKEYMTKNSDYALIPNPLSGQQLAGLAANALTGKKTISRDIMLVSSSTCSLFPLDIQEIQDLGGRFYGINAVSKNMIMFDRRNSDLPHGLVFGRSGSGKSYQIKGEIIPNYLATTDDIIILDPDAEYVPMVQAFGGAVIDFRRKAQFHINPCDMAMEYDNNEADPLAEKCDFMVSLVESILGDNRECNPFEVNAIHRATTKMYDPYVKYMDEQHELGSKIDLDTSRCPTLEDFYNALLEDESVEAAKLAMLVEPYCIGQYNIFAHKTDITDKPRLLVYNLKNLPDKMKPVAMKVCLANIWARVCENKEKKKATWIYLDEFYLLMQTESAATTLQTFFKRIRKYGGIMTGITQDITDLLSTLQGTGMIENSGFILFMNQSPSGRERIQQRYQIPDVMIDFCHDRGVGKGLIYTGKVMSPFDYKLPTEEWNILHKLMTTRPSDNVEIKNEDII